MKDELLLKYGAGGTDVIHPIALGFALLMVILVFRLPRRSAFVPILLTALFIPLAQRIAILTLDFMMIRIVVLFGFIRLVMRSELQSFKLNQIDKTVILWIISSVLTFTLLFQTIGAFINRLGFAFDAFGIYLLFRSFVLDFKDVERVIRVLAISAVIIAFFMLIEWFNGRNLFAIFGGVPDVTPLRDGHRRCQASFAHSLMAGCFGASLFPLALSLWWGNRKNRKIAIVGCIAATVITLTSWGSGPIVAYFAGIGGLFMWTFRKHIRAILLGGLFSLIFLSIVMKAPVWALFARIKVFEASTGYHRYILFDQFIRRFDEWWLFGTKFTSDWGSGLWDLTNMYINVGVNGGLITLILFTLIIIRSFQAIGKAVQAMENQPEFQRYSWSLGASLLSHTVAFMGMAYFDQMKIIWYMSIAMISVINTCHIRQSPIKVLKHSKVGPFCSPTNEK